MNIEYQYISFPTLYLGNSLRPVARVRMASATNSVIIDLIVDSGADITLIDADVAQALELTAPTSDESYAIGGIGSEIAVYYRQITMTIGEYTFPCRIGVISSSSNTRILGQADVFDQFSIEFRRFESKIIFTHK